MPEPTAEAWAQIRHAYEDTDKPLSHICDEHEITIPMMRYRMKRWNWTRRKPLIPRYGPPPVAQAQDFISPPPVRAANGAEGSGVGGACALPSPEASPPTPLRLADASRSDPPHRFTGGGMEHAAPYDVSLPPAHSTADTVSIVPHLQSAVARVLPAIEATAARLASETQSPREMEQAGRTLSSLTRALRELKSLLAEHRANEPEGPGPENIEEFRERMIQRIRGIIEARKAARDARMKARAANGQDGQGDEAIEGAEDAEASET